MAVTPALTVGAAFGFANQNVSTGNGAAFSGDTFQFELYGSLRQGVAFLDMQAGGGFSEGTATRPQYLYGVRASGNANGATAGGSVHGGVRLDEGPWRIEPGVTLAGVTLRQAALAETQGGAEALSLGSASLGSLQTVVDVRVERRIAIGGTMALVPSARLGWLHESLDTRATTTASLLGAPFTVQSAPAGRDAAVLGLRAVLETGGPVSAFASYTGALSASSTGQTVSAGLRFAW
jgi:outer membrane autotransporter protein